MNRFQKIYQQGTIDVIEIWLDTETGVQYLFHKNGNAGGFTPLLDREGKQVVSFSPVGAPAQAGFQRPSSAGESA